MLRKDVGAEFQKSREVVDKTREDRTRMGSSVALHVIGNEARDQVTVKREKKLGFVKPSLAQLKHWKKWPSPTKTLEKMG